MTLTAQEAFNHLDPQAWTQVSIAERLEILAAIQENMRTYGEELGYAQNTSFKQELQAVQKAMTFSYLKMKLPAEEISSLIGYSEVNAFSRAFKKWTGMTVTDYKKQQGL
ncbi:TPA: helix-turn-helix domain-containing protein [Streptococcus suis]